MAAEVDGSLTTRCGPPAAVHLQVKLAFANDDLSISNALRFVDGDPRRTDDSLVASSICAVSG
ncbi:hypothetical protein C2R22_23030 (plasmid) [Salinigranum rubrum]|uniref:Uncharacterized protein n=1 Tax=Salinigranum rubrum TaxID=755307 RepID=A0A2I8VR72_9EURY|nr:hypothetical protein C2R22_23030 [Salinigranum rubrum]